MAVIHVLSHETIDKIAAGEVVERPSSIVKELVENAVDAGAGAITVEIKDGGVSFIRVSDNGCGIEKSEIRKAFLRHATSKIQDADDLLRLHSLGFRGEALSSISAVSQTEMITKTPRELTGVRLSMEGGMETDFEEVGAPDGTTIIIRNLFFNVPARRKFLKQPATEGGYVADLMEHLALANPQISFQFIQNNQVKFSTAGNGDLKQTIYKLYGKDMADSLIGIDKAGDGIRLSGYLGKPSVNRSNRNYELYFLNGRFIRSNLVARAIEEGYKSYLMQHKYPFCVLMMEVEPSRVDVNVHPAKMEVRFTEEMRIYEFLASSVREVLDAHEMIPEIALTEPEEKEEKKEKALEPFQKARSEMRVEGIRSVYGEPQNEKEELPDTEAVSAERHAKQYGGQKLTSRDFFVDFGDDEEEEEENAGDTDEVIFSDDAEIDGAGRVPEDAGTGKIGIIPKDAGMNGTGEAPDTATKMPELIRTDGQKKEDFTADSTEKHIGRVSEEKGMYHIGQIRQENEQLELFKEKIISPSSRQKFRILGQAFDTYWIVVFEDKLLMIDQHAAHEKVKFERIMKAVRESEIFSQNLYPPLVLSLSGREQEVLERFREAFTKLGFELEYFGGNEITIRSAPTELFGNTIKEMFLEVLDELSVTGVGRARSIEERIATMACKAAVKGNRSMSVPEMETLLDELLTLENPYFCPHGRPTIISFTKQELEKKFKRIV